MIKAVLVDKENTVVFSEEAVSVEAAIRRLDDVSQRSGDTRMVEFHVFGFVTRFDTLDLMRPENYIGIIPR